MSWEIEWYSCKALAADVAHAHSEGRKIEIGDELWRVPRSIGPITIGQNYWAGWFLEADEKDIHLAARAPDLLEALKDTLQSLEYVETAHPQTSGIERRVRAIDRARKLLAEIENA